MKGLAGQRLSAAQPVIQQVDVQVTPRQEVEDIVRRGVVMGGHQAVLEHDQWPGGAKYCLRALSSSPDLAIHHKPDNCLTVYLVLSLFLY